jgi:stage III sporulation protein AA
MHESILSILPVPLKSLLLNLPESIQLELEEIRIRENRPFEINFKGNYAFVSPQGELLDNPAYAYLPSREDCVKLLDLLTNHSLYTFEEELKRGYLTIAGGHRVGLAGRTILEHGRVKLIRDISGFNIRIAREVIDCGKQLLPFLLQRNEPILHHTLIISPPQYGKTTIIRDLARLISYGHWPYAINGGGMKVGIVDERSELAACYKGVPRFDVGPRTDILDCCPKAEGMMMMVRSMSPQVIIVDEIGTSEDAAAIHEVLHAGIRIIASAHAQDLNDIQLRPTLRQLYQEAVFSRYVILRKTDGKVKVDAIYDGQANRLLC